MPPVGEQIELPGAFPNPELFAVRFLLKPGRKYQTAVQQFRPHEKLPEVKPEGRSAGAQLVRRVTGSGRRSRGFIFLSNRFGDNALASIAVIVAVADSE